MQESDYTILQELGKVGLLSSPPLSLSKLTTDHLFQICCQFLRNNNIQLPDLQRFKLASKVTEQFNRLTNFGLTINHLLHFNPNQTRKILITILSFESKNLQPAPTKQSHKRTQTQMIKQWLQKQYVHHHLRLKRRPTFDLVDIPNLQDPELFLPGKILPKQNLLCRLSQSLQVLQPKVETNIEFATKPKSKLLNFSKCEIHQISLISQNFNADSSVVARDQQSQQTADTAYLQQEDLIQALSNHINQLSIQLKAQEKLLQHQNSQRLEIQQLLKDEESKLNQLRDSVKLTRQMAEQQKIKLQAIQDPTAMREEITRLQKELKQIKKIGQSHIESLQQQIIQLRQSKQQRISYFKSLKIKSKAFEKDYFELIQKLEEKQVMDEQIEVSEGGVPRIVYTRRIAQLESKWRESRKELQQLSRSLKQLHSQNEQKQKTLNKLIVELQNILNLQKKADDNLFQIKELFKFYKETSLSILSSLFSSLDSKRQANDLDFRIAELKNKDLQASIARIEFMLQDIRAQKRN